MLSPSLLYQLIASKDVNSPEALAIRAPGMKALTYRGLSQHLRTTALQLTRLGIRASDRLAVVLPNGSAMATAFLAISSVCECAPLNPSYKVEELKTSMEDLQIKALVTYPGRDTPARTAAASLEIPVIELVMDRRKAGVFSLSTDLSRNLPMDETISDPILAGIDDVTLVLQTSGTTSHPKTVALTHRNIFHSINNITETYALSSADVCLNMMPLFHVHGLIAALAASLSVGASIVCAPGFLPDHVLDWLSELAPTWYTAVPTMHQIILEQILNHPEVAGKLNLRFIRSCSSSLAPQVAQDLEMAFGVPVVEAYGMTEATHQIASNPLPPGQHKFGSVGLPTGTTRVSIIDEDGKVLPVNTIGEICIRGENVIHGYENNPAANATNFIDGWLRTGDSGFLDEEGYLFIQGRLKEQINRGGEKISPREIDEVLLSHPAVKQAVTFAVSHPSLGEDVGAAIVLRNGQSVSVPEMRQFVAVRLADFKIPRQIVFVQEIPKGATGKIQRIGMAERLKAELDTSTTQGSTGTTAPSTLLEADLLSIWQRVLDKQKIGVQDDFLALGGESIQAGRILFQVNERFDIDLKISDIFSASTVALMANLIQAKKDLDISHD